MSQIRVNITTRVNSKSIRREIHNGRDHFVIPSYTLPSNVVMNDILYPAAEIDRTYMSLDGTLAPLGHPTVNGAFVSAFSPEGINVGHVGAWNRNAKKSGNRIYVEKWLDIEVAGQSESGKRLLERLDQIEKGEDVPPIHTSVGAFIEANAAPEGAEYKHVAKIINFDHDAILLDEVGAATPEQGVGIMVNADKAVPLKTNSGALIGESFREREHRLQSAATKKFASGHEEYAWIADFTDNQAVVVRNGGVSEVFGYKTEGGKIVFDETGEPVVRQESWVVTAVNSASMAMKRIFNPQARPAINQKEDEMSLTAEEKAALLKEVGSTVATNMAEALKPVTDTVTALSTTVTELTANQKALSDSLTANARAEEAAKRETVKAKFGEVVANSLSGQALDDMVAQCGTAAPLAVNGAPVKTATTGVPDLATHFGDVK